MNTKTLHVNVKDADQGLVEAVFSTFNVIDHDGDVTLPGAFTDGEEVRISAYGHASWGSALPVGKGRIRADSDRAVLEGEFFLNTATGRDTFEVVKGLGGLQEWSYGFDVVEAESGQHDGKDVQFLKKLKVYEVSPVLLGAGIDTRTLAVKSGLKFFEHATSVLTDVDELITRAADIVMKRREQGKALGAESADMLVRLDGQLQRLADLATEPEPPTNSSDELMREYARFVATLQGETTS